MTNAILQPWPWYVSGPLIGLAVPLLLLFGGRNLGISSSFRHICAAVLPKSGLAYLRGYDWRESAWNLFFAAGLIVGGAIASLALVRGRGNPPYALVFLWALGGIYGAGGQQAGVVALSAGIAALLALVGAILGFKRSPARWWSGRPTGQNR
jgi:hypothetical protein